jgi:hypothetical protein
LNLAIDLPIGIGTPPALSIGSPLRALAASGLPGEFPSY